MKRSRIAAVLSAAALMVSGLALASPAQAATAAVTPTADTWLNSNQSTQNNGAALRLVANGSPQKMGLVKFDVALPAGATVTGATLTLTSPTAQTPGTLEVRAVDASWTEATTWSTRPTPGAVLDTATLGATGTKAVFDVPVSGPGTVAFAIMKSTAGDLAAASRENSAANRPTLSVVYSTDGTPPPPAAACGDGTDNDGDGAVDYPADPGCASATDTDETDTAPPPPPPPSSGLPYPSGSLLYQPLPPGAPVSAGQAQFQSYLHAAEPVDFWKVRGSGQGIAMNYSIVHANECADPDVELFTISSTGNTPNQDHLKTSGFHARTSTMQAIQQNSDSPGIFVDECGTAARPGGLSVWAANLLYDGTTVLKSGGDGTITAGSFAHGTNGLDSRAPSSDAAANQNIVSRGRIPETMLITDAEVRAGLAGANGGTAGHVVEVFFVETSSAAGFQEPMVGAESGKVGCGSSTIICAEGQYVRIDPGVNLAARPGCTGAALVVARTLQVYGGYLGDNSGAGSGIKMEQLSDYASPNMLDPCMNLSDLQIIQKGYVPPHS